MTERRSRFDPERVLRLGVVAVVALLGSGCVALDHFLATPKPAPPRYLLETPPQSPDLIGAIRFRETVKEDTLVDLAPELGVGYVELLAANPGIDPWLPPAGTRLIVPDARLLPSGPREGIVVNLGDLRLYYFAKVEAPRSYPIVIAKDGYATPLGAT